MVGLLLRHSLYEKSGGGNSGVNIDMSGELGKQNQECSGGMITQPRETELGPSHIGMKRGFAGNYLFMTNVISILTISGDSREDSTDQIQ